MALDFEEAPKPAYSPETNGARCELCPFGGKERLPVPPAAPSSGKVRLIVVGEGPGRHELVKGLPFVGLSGRMLDDCFSKAGFPRWRRETFVTNAALCNVPGSSDAEKEEAAACCAPRLLKELSGLPKDVPIVTLGKPAARTILGVNGVMKVRGFIWRVREVTDASVRTARRVAEKAREKGRGVRKRSERILIEKEVAALGLKADILQGRQALHGRVVLPSIHPAFVLRSALFKPVLQTDLDRVVRFLTGEVRPLDADPKFKILKNLAEIKKALPTLGPEISHDIETDSKDPLEAVIRCLAFSDGKRTFVIAPWRRKYAAEVSKCFKKRTVVGHNSYAYDSIALEREGVVYGKHEDTLVAHHAFASHFPQGLSFVCSMMTDIGAWKITFKQGAEGAEKGIPTTKMPVDDMIKYCAVDVIATIAAWRAMQPDLEVERSVYEHDKKLAAMCHRMQVAGIAVDLEGRAKLSKALLRRSNRFLRRMRELTGKKTFNPYRAADLRWALYEKFRAPVLNLTEKTQLPATNAVQLEHLAQSPTRYGKLSRFILRYRGARGTRQRNIEGVYVSRDGRVHASWKSFGTQNGRFSCKMQQLPRVANKKRPALEDQIRRLYKAPDGKIYVYFDIKQAEMKLAAFLSQDENFIKVAMSKDVHAANAKIIWPAAAKDIDEGRGGDLRSIAKQVGFAINYGSGEVTILQTLHRQGQTKVTIKTVRQLLLAVQKEFKQHFRHVDKVYKETCVTGHMRSPLVGRIRWLGWTPKLQDCMNTPVQQGVADHINLRMIEMLEKGLPKGCELIFQGHDSCCFECLDDSKTPDEMERVINEIMLRPVRLKNGREFVLTIDMKRGKRMSDVS